MKVPLLILHLCLQEMNSSRYNDRRVEQEKVNQWAPQGDQSPQDSQDPIDPLAMLNEEIRSALQVLAQALEFKTNGDVVTHVNPNINFAASR